MPRLSLVALVLCAASLVAGCQFSAPGKAASGPSAQNALTGGEIEVTELDAPADAMAPTPAAAEPAGEGKAAPQAAPTPETAPTAKPGSPAPKADLEATPVTPKSEMQLACEKKHGRWSGIGKGDARACIFQTRDGGKQCDRESQCEGVCLARSGTCSPFKPLYGCNDILQDNGARVRLCLD
ncbi:MAG: hypothetical protein WAT35_18385 [Tabrizicola sp.]|uniref:hypothetical protein n=1 Tax=Tabrizicola sp. TaxID=2005166 RepID=UPI003BAEA6A0